MRQVIWFLVMLSFYTLSQAADVQETSGEQVIPVTYKASKVFTVSYSSATTYNILIMINPKKQINSGTTYYSLSSTDETSTLITYKGKDLSNYQTTGFEFVVNLKSQ